MSIKSHFAYKKLYKTWREKNAHNFTEPFNHFPIELVTVGKGTYGLLTVLASNMENTCRIGNYCSIARNVTFVLSADHAIDRVSTYPFQTYYGEGGYEGVSKGNIVLEDDVWVGFGATILSGVHIGQGAVVAAGAVVTKDVPPYAVVAGVPAQILKYRFDEETIAELMKIDYANLSEDMIRSHMNQLYEKVEDVRKYDWLTGLKAK